VRRGRERSYAWAEGGVMHGLKKFTAETIYTYIYVV
jgi:hypothetical protein